jgi:hypothetical protein
MSGQQKSKAKVGMPLTASSPRVEQFFLGFLVTALDAFKKSWVTLVMVYGYSQRR